MTKKVYAMRDRLTAVAQTTKAKGTQWGMKVSSLGARKGLDRRARSKVEMKSRREGNGEDCKYYPKCIKDSR